MPAKRRRITITLDPNQLEILDGLMKEDYSTNFSFFITNLIIQEKKRRAGELDQEKPSKRSVGRPKKKSLEQEIKEDKNSYPAPYKGGAVYTRGQLEAYWQFRVENGEITEDEIPPLPAPLTPEELRKFDD